jgi:DNA-binding transcriptional ArsR family regulator
MVVDYLTENEVDRIFHALADATRRDIVKRALHREYTVSTLADRYAMSFAAVQKHVAVLERASLVTKEVRGRERVVRGNVAMIRRASGLLAEFEAIWRHRVRVIEEILAEDSSAPTPPPPSATTPESDK